MAEQGRAIAPEEFGKRLRAWREKQGKTQLEVAVASGTTPQTISEWESGRLSRPLEILAGLIALGFDANTALSLNGRKR